MEKVSKVYYYHLLNNYAQRTYKLLSEQSDEPVDKFYNGPFCSAVSYPMYSLMKNDKRFDEVSLLSKFDDSGQHFLHQFIMVRVGKTEFIVDPTYQQASEVRQKHKVLIIERSKLDSALKKMKITADMWWGAKRVVNYGEFPEKYDKVFSL